MLHSGQLGCGYSPSTDTWVMEIQHMSTRGCSSARQKNEIMSFAGQWMEPGKITLSEVTQTRPHPQPENGFNLKPFGCLPCLPQSQGRRPPGPTWIRDLMLAKCVSMAPPWGKFWFILFISSVKQLKARASGDSTRQWVSQATASGIGAPEEIV